MMAAWRISPFLWKLKLSFSPLSLLELEEFLEGRSSGERFARFRAIHSRIMGIDRFCSTNVLFVILFGSLKSSNDSTNNVPQNKKRLTEEERSGHKYIVERRRCATGLRAAGVRHHVCVCVDRITTTADSQGQLSLFETNFQHLLSM